MSRRQPIKSFHDVFRVKQDIYDIKRTNIKGLRLYFGLPSRRKDGHCGRTKLIITPRLVRYLKETRPMHNDLPISLAAVTRLRRRLGIADTRETWWNEHREELITMKPLHFAARHKLPMSTVYLHRRAALTASRK